MIPGVRPRALWQDPAQPITGPARRDVFRQGVIHWEGVNRGSAPADVPAFLRAMQASYLRSRGYSLGYGYAVISDVRHPFDGACWEIRGADINMASNPGRRWNDLGHSPSGNANNWTGSVLIIGPTGNNATPKAAATIGALFGAWHKTAGTARVRPVPHSVLDYTSCCGDPYRADINAGRFDPSTATEPQPPDEGDDMAAIAYILQPPSARTGSPWLVIVDADVRPATSYDLESDKLPVHQETNQYAVEQYDVLRKAAGV